MPAKKDFDAELIKLIEDEIATDPFELDGRKWARIIGQDGLAAHLGVSTKTLARRLAKPPFKRRVKRIEGEANTLLRIREADEPDDTPEEKKRIKANADRKAMGFAWKVKTGKWPDYHQANLLWGFALDLAAFPEVEPVEVFKFALKDWQFVASAIKLAALATPEWKVRFLDYPEIGHMRRFWKAVLHAYVSRLQSDGKIPEGKINDFAAILRETDFEPIPDDVPYPDEEHVAALMAKKAEKIAAKKAKKAGMHTA
jgi:hypothetical protein